MKGVRSDWIDEETPETVCEKFASSNSPIKKKNANWGCDWWELWWPCFPSFFFGHHLGTKLAIALPNPGPSTPGRIRTDRSEYYPTYQTIYLPPTCLPTQLATYQPTKRPAATQIFHRRSLISAQVVLPNGGYHYLPFAKGIYRFRPSCIGPIASHLALTQRTGDQSRSNTQTGPHRVRPNSWWLRTQKPMVIQAVQTNLYIPFIVAQDAKCLQLVESNMSKSNLCQGK